MPRPAPRAPDGTPPPAIALMFTDIQGSTALWDRLGDSFRPVLDRHNAVVREVVGACGGEEVKSHGDSFMLAFEDAASAVDCAVNIQSALARCGWPSEVGELLEAVREAQASGEVTTRQEALTYLRDHLLTRGK